MARTRDPQRFHDEQERIRTAAESCFIRAGFRGAGIQEICHEAGISPGRFYHYFPSKQALVEAVATADSAEAEEYLATLAGARDRDGILAVFATAVDAMAEPHAARLAAELVAEAGRDPAVAVLFRASADRIRTGLGGILARHQRSGIIALADDPDATARRILLVMDGVVGSLLDPDATGRQRTCGDALAVIARLLAPASD